MRPLSRLPRLPGSVGTTSKLSQTNPSGRTNVQYPRRTSSAIFVPENSVTCELRTARHLSHSWPLSSRYEVVEFCIYIGCLFPGNGVFHRFSRDLRRRINSDAPNALRSDNSGLRPSSDSSDSSDTSYPSDSPFRRSMARPRCKRFRLKRLRTLPSNRIQHI
jgi:hypothetical protein